MKLSCTLFAALAAVAVTSTALRAWDYEGHRMVNEIALASLPADFPKFVHEADNAERIAFLAGEPDRWRNVPDLSLRNVNDPDHYLDLEQVPEAGLEIAKLPPQRTLFALEFTAGRTAHIGEFPPIDPTKNLDHTREWCGFLPWAIAENYDKLRSEFSYLKVFEELGTPAEIANAKADIVYTMGVMGHYVGDGAQPLHTTKHHHGWVGANPNGYTTAFAIHQWIDGGLIAKAGIKLSELAPNVVPAQPISLAAQPDGRDPMFVAAVNYVVAGNALVEPLYRLEKDHKLGDLPNDSVAPEGRDFVATQLLKGGETLGAIWLTAWRSAVPDTYLRKQLLLRQVAAAPAPGK